MNKSKIGPASLLKLARETLTDPQRWTQKKGLMPICATNAVGEKTHYFDHNATAWSLGGALARSLRELETKTWDVSRDGYREAIRLLLAVIRSQPLEDQSHLDSPELDDYNCLTTTTHSDVLRAIDSAIVLASVGHEK